MALNLKLICFLLFAVALSSDSVQAGGRHSAYGFVAVSTPVVVLNRAPFLYHVSDRYAHPTAYEYMHSPVFNPVLAVHPAPHLVNFSPYLGTYSYPVHRLSQPVFIGW